MNIFISWSGDLSKKIAKEIKDWIPMVLQSAKPYFTPEDIEKGMKWESEITGKLNDSSVGIICLTRENLEKPWILFEAGALSNKLEKSKVCPLLFDLKNSDLTGPLSTFQSTLFEKTEFKKLMSSINKSLGDVKVDDKVFESVFEMFYPQLEEKIVELIDKDKSKQKKGGTMVVERTDRDLLEEILKLTRKQYSNTGDANNQLGGEFQLSNNENVSNVSRYIYRWVRNYLIINDYQTLPATSEAIDLMFRELLKDQQFNSYKVSKLYAKTLMMEALIGSING